MSGTEERRALKEVDGQNIRNGIRGHYVDYSKD